MIKYLFFTLLISNLISCSFKKDEEGLNSGVLLTEDLEEIPLERDFDGDMVTDVAEITQGRNYKVADLPKLNVRFLQNFKAIVSYLDLKTQELGSFEIDTNIHKDDPDFKYRVGKIFIRDISLNKAASIGKFNSHIYGDIEEHDLTWVKYPDVDRSFHAENLLKYKKYFDTEAYEITDVTLELENSIKLLENQSFKNLKNPSLSFYYYNYEKESYELLKEEKIERHLQSGVNETFTIKIEAVPAKLILENFFERGEFVISELTDYEIPELETTYKILLASVKAKSLPVIYNTPLESSTFYVGTDGKKLKFKEILSSLFDKKFEVSEDQLFKINQFENNLSDYTNLLEVSKEDKKGKWFIFTNKLTKHFLDHDFSPSDSLSLSYILGSELADQRAEAIFSYRSEAKSGDYYSEFPLGNAGLNSTISIQLIPNKTYGEKLKSWEDIVISHGGSCGKNCFSNEYSCYFRFNLFEEINEANNSFSFKQSFDNELGRVTLRLNQEEYKLSDLLNEKKIEVKWFGEHLHIKIPKISNLQEVTEVKDNILSLKLASINNEVEEGVFMYQMTGQQHYYCPVVIGNVAGPNSWPINVNSKDFGAWQHLVNWNAVKQAGKKTHHEEFSLGVSSLIENKFN